MTLEIEKIERIDLKPGEVLAVTLGYDMSNSEAAEVRERWDKQHPDIPAIFFAPGTKLSAINLNAE